MARELVPALDEMARVLRHRLRRKSSRDYRVPKIWNCWGWTDCERVGRGEIAVDPHRFALSCIEQVILPARGRRRLAGRSLSRVSGIRRATGGKVRDGKQRRAGDWIARANLYSMMVRLSTAWDHDGNGTLTGRRWTDTGTFLKSILLLPLLRRMGFTGLYLLPVSKTSRKFKKGEIGCPYSAKNFFELEPDLHDRMLGPRPVDLEMQFAAFVEAAHALDMRVMVDLAPRTASRDSDLILDHPDWFYWIDVKAARNYGPPQVEGVEPGIPKPAQLGRILQRDELRHHLNCFRHAPGVTAPQRWRRFVRRCRAKPPADLLAAIGREFGVITPPGFSDVVNDPQPPWSDVTFLRLFLDHPASSAKYLDDPQQQPPYVFADTIKASRFPGRRPNLALWKALANVLPFYQRFGIDGARVDMGHALPPKLQDMIVATPRRTDPDFCFLAEEFNHGAARAARRAGYNAIIGSAWWHEPRGREGKLHSLIHDLLPATALPALAAAETPDTPRAAARDGGRAFARLAAVLNCFLPNGIPFVNSGLEIFERQPLNLGLDSEPSGRFVLPKSDPNYGRLAYFDRAALHWANAGAGEMVALLGQTANVRQRFLDTLAAPQNCLSTGVDVNRRWILTIGWRADGGRSTLLIAANVDCRRRRRCVVGRLPGRSAGRRNVEVLVDTHRDSPPPQQRGGRVHVALEPGQVKVMLL